MQKSIIVDTVSGNARLNQYLEDGWKIVHSCPMPSSCSVAVSVVGDTSYPLEKSKAIDTAPTCLVILEK